MLVTANRNISEWGTVFGDAIVATDILDRLSHHSHVVTIRGDSYNLRAQQRSGLLQEEHCVITNRRHHAMIVGESVLRVASTPSPTTQAHCDVSSGSERIAWPGESNVPASPAQDNSGRKPWSRPISGDSAD